MSAKIAIAFQGTPGAFSHQAAMKFAEQLGVEATYVPSQTFGEIFERVSNGEVAYGAIPLENSSIGSIVANYDLLWSYDCFIVAEHFLPVHHHLIGFEGTPIQSIKTVYSHPAALDQCRKLFKDHGNMAPRVHWNTSGAVEYVKAQGDHSFAAIAGELAAKEYNMSILMENIEDYSHNATRFGLIRAKKSASTDPALPKGQPYKVSFVAELAHKSGTLAGLLNALSKASANLTKIESRPIGETPWHYRFFIDTEVPSADAEPRIEAALSENSDKHKLLGRYAPALHAVKA